MTEAIAYTIIFFTCWILAALAFHAIKWMILNWPEDPDKPEDVPGIIRWLQKAFLF